ncbi:glutamate-rich protein 5 [Paraburkholderia fungorum]|nr:glutamate-rich protein 5 [Paraburkholderia fungorum]
MWNLSPRTFRPSDKAVIPPAALRAPIPRSYRHPATASTPDPPAAVSRLDPPAAVSRLDPPAAVSRLDPPAAVSRLDPPAAVSRLDPPAAVSRLDPPAAVSRLDPPAAVSRLDPPAAVSRLDPPAAVSRLDPPAAISRLDSPAAVFAPRFVQIRTRRRIAVTRPRPHSPVCPGSLPAAPLLRAQPRQRSRSHRESESESESESKAPTFPNWGLANQRGHLAEAKPTAPAARSEAAGFPGRPVRDARSAEWELMSALSLTRSARGGRFQMYHYRYCAGDPLKN